jgi:protein tyrosine phosphatase
LAAHYPPNLIIQSTLVPKKQCVLNSIHFQYHFTVWPDNGVPSSLEPLVKFVRQVRFEMNRFLDRGPTIIHCSAGVGRTGTFVGYDRLLQDYENKSYVDIFGMVYEMRMSRCLMVQTEVRALLSIVY